MIAMRLFLARRVPAAILAAGALALGAFVPTPARADESPGPPVPCSGSGNGYGVVITSCSFSLESSPAGNPNYFVDVTLRYTAPPNTAVRFRCTLGDGGTAGSQYGVLRSSGGTLKFVSPFAKGGSPVTSVSCDVDAT